MKYLVPAPMQATAQAAEEAAAQQNTDVHEHAQWRNERRKPATQPGRGANGSANRIQDICAACRPVSCA